MAYSGRKAPESVRRQIIEALHDRQRRFFDQRSSSRNFIDRWGLTSDGFFADLAEGLMTHDLYLKPKQSPHDPQRYHCVVCYPEWTGAEALEIHVTLCPRGNPPTVKVAVHPDDGGDLPHIILS